MKNIFSVLVLLTGIQAHAQTQSLTGKEFILQMRVEAICQEFVNFSRSLNVLPPKDSVGFDICAKQVAFNEAATAALDQVHQKLINSKTLTIEYSADQGGKVEHQMISMDAIDTGTLACQFSDSGMKLSCSVRGSSICQEEVNPFVQLSGVFDLNGNVKISKVTADGRFCPGK